MKKYFTLLILMSSLFYLSSCKKDSSDSGNTARFNGKYQFISLTAATVNDQTFNDGITVDRFISKVDYTTKDNQGTLTINDSKMLSQGLAYSIDTVGTTTMYEDGVLLGTDPAPMQMSFPPTDASSDYKWVTSDSVSFSKGGAIFLSGATAPTGPVGMRLKLDGNTLYMSGAMDQTVNQSQSGVSISSKVNVKFTAIYQKQ